MIVKYLSAICFVIAFLMALVLFGRIGHSLVSTHTAKNIFIVSGAIGIFLNLLAYKTEKTKRSYNFWFWLGNLIILKGLIFKLMHWPYSSIIIVVGLAITGISFFYSPKIETSHKQEDLLDDLDS